MDTVDSVHIWSGWYLEPGHLSDDEDHHDVGEGVGDVADEYGGDNVVVVVVFVVVVVVVVGDDDAAYVWRIFQEKVMRFSKLDW